VKRLEQMIGMGGHADDLGSIRSQIASAITLFLQVQRLPDGKRRLISVTEITGMEAKVVQMHEIFSFLKNHGRSGQHSWQLLRRPGFRPIFLERFEAYGVELPASYSITHASLAGLA